MSRARVEPVNFDRLGSAALIGGYLWVKAVQKRALRFPTLNDALSNNFWKELHENLAASELRSLKINGCG